MGHEVTPGFDDSGRLYDKYGNKHQWWSDEDIAKFNDRAQCFVDQYNNFTIPELNDKVHVNGLLTEGEDIADNGGIRESFRTWQQQQQIADSADPMLPGLEHYSREQLFFLALGPVSINLKL